ncbi:MAG: carbohydrate kinase family protein [Patescibacteria group bacterium]
MKYDFITVGGATRDISFFTDQGVLIDNQRDILRQKLLAFESGAKIKVDQFHYGYGGGAANAAVNLAHFNFKTACLTTVGADESGRLIIQNLKNRQVDASLVKTAKKETSGASFILITPSGERIIFGSRGANRSLQISASDSKILKTAKNIYIASLSGKWEKVLRTVFSLTDRGKTKISWNPGATQYAQGIEKLAPYLKKTYVFSLNDDEAIELVLSSKKHRHLDKAFLSKPLNLIKIIKSFGPEIVVITLGTRGVLVYDGREIYFHKIIKEKKRVDTTGIGDIFNSSFVAGLELYHGDINRAMILSLKNTAAKIAYLGAQNGLMKFKK